MLNNVCTGSDHVIYVIRYYTNIIASLETNFHWFIAEFFHPSEFKVEGLINYICYEKGMTNE